MRTIVGLAKKSAILALVAGLAACQAADGTSQAPDVALVDSVMKGLGAVDPNEKPIDYKPRAPLAMPAEPGKLPEPETNVAGTNSENWPQQRENSEYTELKELYAGAGRMRDEPLTPEQMRGFKITGATPVRDREAERRFEEISDGQRLTRAEQAEEWEKLQKIRAQQAGLTKSGLATRRFLTEPPTDYSTPSPDAPMPDVVSKKKRKPSNHDVYDSKPLDPRCLEGESAYCN
ncbi:MAG: hypothetical protein JJ866_01490 [Roseibium sp.]|uniref:hypothetical protein n=1 Tax=Roseibium sp. TaxID=1936156 RepID=UPI001B13F41F|nr:hypothetical protein [Roseibium sp.]MBO6890587.1 hypothetical protein [Roseibium sp.]MBO6930147.1 hypothetical protein [Roseibium sp.]